ncbi:uncharacterized protein [Watersipora subatra]|uniref:uncharacterized protein isoform X2 n=1 Tax=Watersipora subatra TaxID=2589382 RepID=UPI00355BFD14
MYNNSSENGDHGPNAGLVSDQPHENVNLTGTTQCAASNLPPDVLPSTSVSQNSADLGHRLQGDQHFGSVNGLSNDQSKQAHASESWQHYNQPDASTSGSRASNSHNFSASLNKHNISQLNHHYYGSSSPQSSGPSISLTDRRFKNTRQHIVPPNNHSPKPVSFVEHLGFASHNAEATSYNGTESQQSHYYRPVGNQEILGNVSNHQDEARSQPYFGGSYPSGSKSWSSHLHQQLVNPILSSVNNDTDASFMNGPQTSSLLSAFGSSTSASAATAVANIASLIHPSTSSTSLSSNGADAQPPAIAVPGTQRLSYGQNNTKVNAPLHASYLGINSQVDQDPSLPLENALANNLNARNHSNLVHERIVALQREVEKERAARCQLQQRVLDLSQQVHSQSLVEKSYEDVVQKYKMVVSQMQHMSLAMERYKAMAQQLEQERQMLAAENNTLKAQNSTVVNDKTMKYNMLVERSKKLEEENSGLVLENETYQRQYEKCVDEISKQVVQALLTQKALQEQCMQLQDRLVDLERENAEYFEAAVRQARQASSDSRLGWSSRRARPHAASPSADSVRSMPAQHLYWRQSSLSSLELQQHSEQTMERNSSPGAKAASATPTVVNSVSIETEFPANNGSPKSTRRSLERHPSSGSLDSAYHSRGFVRGNGKDVRYQRSVSAEALRDVKVKMRVKGDATLPKSNTASTMSAINPSNLHITHAQVHKDLSPDSSVIGDARTCNDPFADDADNILSKHQSLIVGSMEDLFSTTGPGMRDFVIHEEESGSNSAVSTQERCNACVMPTPPPRPRSRCLSDCSNPNDIKLSLHAVSQFGPMEAEDGGPPPLPPKQYKGSRRKFKPLPAEPPESQDEGDDSSDKNTDSESIKQELNALTSQISSLASHSAYHN